MIEAYEIGVSVALRDGVSETIALMKRDLQAVELALRGSSVSLARLHAAARQAKGSAVEMDTPKPGRAQAGNVQGGRDVQRQPVPEPAEKEMGPLMAPVGALLPPKVTSLATMGERSPEPPHNPPAAPVGSQQMAPQAARGLHGTMPISSAAPLMPRIAVAFPPHEMSQAVLPIQVPTPMAAAPVARAADTGPTDAVPMAANYVQRFAVTAPAGRIVERLTPGTPQENTLAEDSQADPLTGPRLPAAPVAPKPSDRVAAESSPELNSGTPPADGPTSYSGGDLYLDGAVIGRWISGLLARSAQRGAVGPTGFDSRRSPILPGAVVGR